MRAPKKTKKKNKRSAKIQEIPALESKCHEGVGRRKTAVARVRIAEQEKGGFFLVNTKPMAEYFQDVECQRIALEILEKITLAKPLGISVYIQGGGIRAQAEAVRHGLARALVSFDQTLRPQFSALKFLTLDPRMRDRKKFGLKRARRARQWRKR
jgi:small subunit ribosomal protein S9